MTSEQKADSKFDPEDRLELLDFSNSLALRLFEKKLQDKHKGKIPPMLSFRSISLDEYRQRRHGPPPNSPEDPAPLTLSPVAFNLGGHLNEPGQSDQYSHAMLKAQAWHALFNLVSPSRTPESELEVQQNIGHAMRHVLTIGNSSLNFSQILGHCPQSIPHKIWDIFINQFLTNPGTLSSTKLQFLRSPGSLSSVGFSQLLGH